jgi:competence protein ComEA
MTQTRTLKHALAALLSAAILVCGVAAPSFAEAARTPAQRPPAAAKDKVTTPVNLNTANTTELQSLPGVGPAVAGRILEYRQKNGGFKKIEDLMNVRGIGEKTFLKLKPMITIAPPKANGL